MTQHSHLTAPTQFVEANGIRFAYRRFGKTGGIPLVFNQHFTGTMDHWDPLVTDGLAATREVILFNNAGISSTSGEVPAYVEEMGANAIAFIKALGLKQVDVLGFSIGSSPRRSRCKPPSWSGAWCWSARARAAARTWRRSRRKSNRSSAPPTRYRKRSG
jgi:pimeloyl-ACP methyl ester carboxylesterase